MVTQAATGKWNDDVALIRGICLEGHKRNEAIWGTAEVEEVDMVMQACADEMKKMT